MNTIESRMELFNSLILEMSDAVYRSLELSFDALRHGDKNLALEVMEGDEKINFQEASIHTHAIEILTLLQPLAKDLRLIIGGIRIANDLERMGDYAKSVARFVIKVPNLNESLVHEIDSLQSLLMHNLEETFSLLSHRDIKGAYDASLLDDDLDMVVKALLYKVVEDKLTNSANIIEVTSILRSIERAGDHAKNICEIVIYIENGEFIDFG